MRFRRARRTMPDPKPSWPLLPYALELVRASKTPPFVDGIAQIAVLAGVGLFDVPEIYEREAAIALLRRQAAMLMGADHEQTRFALEHLERWPTHVCFVWLKRGSVVVVGVEERELTELLACTPTPGGNADAV